MKPVKRVFDEIIEELEQIRTGIQIVAVTKNVGIERTEEVIRAGVRHIGENRPEGLLRKKAAITADVSWHFIGSLQTRKVKDVIDHIDFLHSLDRLSLAKEIQKRAKRPIDCFVQVNVSGEASKHGVAKEEIHAFIESLAAFDKIRVIGLMTMAPFTEDEQIIRNTFSELKRLQLEIAGQGMQHAPCSECSMGMSNDYRIAAEEGTTFVRIGTALVGSESEGVQ